MSKELQYKIIISDRAVQMMANHIQFLAKDNILTARKVKHDLVEVIRSLDKMPERFPFLDVNYIPVNKYHKMFVKKWYLVLYQIKDLIVYVDYIVDCRQDYNWLIK